MSQGIKRILVTGSSGMIGTRLSEVLIKEGMISLDRNLEKLYKDKIITKEVAQSQMENPEILDKFRSL
ncbi:MAG: hypothetical protein V1649_01210 [Patescibacteria group bacterium]